MRKRGFCWYRMYHYQCPGMLKALPDFIIVLKFKDSSFGVLIFIQ